MTEAHDALVDVTVTVNGRVEHARIEPRLLLTDFLRHRLRLTGTHVGCEHGVCGACTVLVDGEPQRACLVFAVQVDGAELRTIEGVAAEDGTLHPVQSALVECHGLQCGFCTPGFVMSMVGCLERDPHAPDEELMDVLGGNLCRCTGYRGIIEAARLARKRIADGSADGSDS